MGIYSAGIVLFRRRKPDSTSPPEPLVIEILLVHPGGPFWANKDTHGWSIPKGEYDPTSEDGWAAAQREFTEELGCPVPKSQRIELGSIKASSKTIHSWLMEGDFDPKSLVSNLFEMEWPPKSGKMKEFPEVDRCGWFDLQTAETKLHKGQVPLLAKIAAALVTLD